MKLEGLADWITPWHGVEASEEEAGAVPECYEPKEWRLFWVAANASSGKRKFNHKTALSMACEDCQLFYQLKEMKAGRCHPVRFSETPLFRPVEDAE